MTGRAALVRTVRLATGLVLATYLSTHLANHALGLVSLGAMEAGRAWFLAVWRSPPGTAALYTALVVHALLAFWSLYARRTLRLSPWEALQLVLGLTIPPLIAAHVVGTRLAAEWFGTEDSYRRLVLFLWVLRPDAGLRQAVALAVAWTHACMGLHFWLRLRPGYARLFPAALVAYVLLPVLALLGFAQAGREVAGLAAREPGWIERTLRETRAPDAAARAALDGASETVALVFATGLAGVLLARAIRRAVERRHTVRVTYGPARHVTVPRGFSVLEASRFAAIPHASVCGGRGRCSTCRVRVTRGVDGLPPPSADETRVLHRVAAPPGVRLACQLRPVHDLAVTLVLPPDARAVDGGPRPPHVAGQEREIAVMFADLRSFTRIAERRLPYDVVFLLNRYFETIGGAIARAGGVVNQFTGDGAMALFGVETGAEEGARQALAAAGEIVDAIAGLSRSLADELDGPLRVGMGVHVGPAVVGRMGFGEARYLTAVGDTVHVASRLQDLTKQYDCQLVMSERAAERAGIDAAGFPRHELTVRNRREPLAIRVVDDVARLAAVLAPPGGAGRG
jgi:adenylate cyclase